MRGGGGGHIRNSGLDSYLLLYLRLYSRFFKGNCIRSAVAYTTRCRPAFDATSDIPLQGEMFVIKFEFDALGRENSSTDALGRIIRRNYELGGGLTGVSTSSDGQGYMFHIQ
ncbi:hypothetical protein LX32DRAFT_428304 [Colletotrichum zoysiae]|uniref:Uncharacterized protein n=1 Tax=Colletotrichum zoysiae TaxID=1216348 RepID=A0AAD9M412_9PEZI|nr:hypothetical protein LX32DRAFT_428304 [Colletotrichum zoysiae]